MGHWCHHSVSPQPWTPLTSTMIRERLTYEILKRVDELNVTPGELRRMKPGFRPGYVAKMRDGALFGEKLLFSLAEALGIFVTIDFVYSQRTQLADMALLEAA